MSDTETLPYEDLIGKFFNHDYRRYQVVGIDRDVEPAMVIFKEVCTGKERRGSITAVKQLVAIFDRIRQTESDDTPFMVAVKKILDVEVYSNFTRSLGRSDVYETQISFREPGAYKEITTEQIDDINHIRFVLSVHVDYNLTDLVIITCKDPQDIVVVEHLTKL